MQHTGRNYALMAARLGQSIPTTLADILTPLQLETRFSYIITWI